MSDFRITGDYHSHTTYSHGKGKIADNVAVAVQRGLEYIAITDHAINHPFVGVSPKKYDQIRAEINEVQKQFPNIKVMMGIEGNIIGMSGALDISPQDCAKLDIVLAGFHLTARQQRLSDYPKLVWNGVTRYFMKSTKNQIKRNTKAYINAIKNNKIDILTHIGFRLEVDYKEISKACADYGTYLELSSRHMTPNDSNIEQVLDGGAMLIINSDAHTPEGVGKYDFALDLVAKYAINPNRIANCNGKQLVLRSKS